jgi:hypothetical protein
LFQIQEKNDELLVDQKVLRLDIPMDNVFGMAEINGFDQLVDDFFYVFCLRRSYR